MERNMSKEWDSWEAQAPSHDFVDRVMHELRFEGTPVVPARSWRSPRSLAMLVGAAALLASLALLAASLQQRWGTHSGSREKPQARSASLGDDGERRSDSAGPINSGRGHNLDSGTRWNAHSERAATVDRELRARVSEKLAPRLRAHGVERDPHTGLTIPSGQAGPVGNITREYIQQRIQKDFMPLALACYEAALAKHPALAGTLAIDFMIVGDPSVGGIIDQAKINASSTLHDLELSNCMLGSLQSIVFAAPDNYGWVTVTYPFVLSPGSGSGEN
ncbi:MAG TPA: AgmX/PglI C-terminal domain-containing protein [Polyangiaceae bacterium]|nr:AgmX/PglI C-terminal domain-containing protein [Polyangiaceae bacterium]